MGTCSPDYSDGVIVHYVVVRSDLPIGLMAAQVAHAAGESSPGNLSPGTHAIVLAATAEELATLEQRLRSASAPHAAIRESDAPYEGQLLAIGLAPAPRNVVRRLVSSLPLLRGKEVATQAGP